MSDIAGQAANAAAGVSGDVSNAAVGSDNGQQIPQQQSTNSPGQPNAPPQGDGLNPAWNPLLEKLPSSLHPLATPVLKEWDQNYRQLQEQLSQVQSQYEPINGIPVEQLQAAIGLYQYIEQNPQDFYNQLGEHYGFGQQSDQGQSGQGDDVVDLGGAETNPVLEQLQQQQQAMAQLLVGQYQAEQEKQLSQQIDNELAAIGQANPDWTDPNTGSLNEADAVMLLRIAASANITLNEAAEQLKQYKGQFAPEPRRPAPSVMGNSSHAVPAAENMDPAKLNRTGTKRLVADILAQRSQG